MRSVQTQMKRNTWNTFSLRLHEIAFQCIYLEIERSGPWPWSNCQTPAQTLTHAVKQMNAYRSQYHFQMMAFSPIDYFFFSKCFSSRFIHNLIFVASTFASFEHEHVAHWLWCLCVVHRLFVVFRYDLYRQCVEPKSKGLCFIYANACANAQCMADIWLLQYDWLLPAFWWSFEFMVNWNIGINNETSLRVQYVREHNDAITNETERGENWTPLAPCHAFSIQCIHLCDTTSNVRSLSCFVHA